MLIRNPHSVLKIYGRRLDGLRRTGDSAHDAFELIRGYKREDTIRDVVLFPALRPRGG